MSGQGIGIRSALGAAAVVAGLCGVVYAGCDKRSKRGEAERGALATPAAALGADGVTAAAIEPFDLPDCDATAAAAPTPRTAQGNPAARRAAQRGLEYLAAAAVQWQEHNDCYGCHVQAVTLEALSVGVHHQYDIGKPQVDKVLGGMLHLKGGARHQTGLGYTSPGAIYDTGKVMGTAAFARYDQWVGTDVTDELLANAEILRSKQQASGEVPNPYAARPVSIGPIQGTASAVVAWKQAYERTADDQWLTAVSRAEDYLRSAAARFRQQEPGTIQEINYTLIGLLAAGAGADEQSMVALSQLLEKRQNDDGGWSLTRAGSSEPYATGQTLYALRLMGRTDRDPAIARGTGWLVEKQQKSGAWSSSGFGKAEAMWGVLGLVSMDVLTVAVAGLADGQHVSGQLPLQVEARDNSDGGVSRVELYVDDIPVYGVCGDELSYSWNTAGLADGKHIVDVRAVNTAGKASRRRLEVYAGHHYMTQLGSRYVDGGTAITLRNIAAAGSKNEITVEIFDVEDKAGVVVPASKLATMRQPGSEGAMRFFWDGKDGAGEAQKTGKYVARLSFRDAGGQVVQTEDLEFVHDTPEAQRANWAQVQGSLALPGDAAAANVDVELVDELGNVVQQTKSTGAGNYRFRNVKAGKKYRVRIRKDGFAAAEQEVAPAMANEAKADMQLYAH